MSNDLAINDVFPPTPLCSRLVLASNTVVINFSVPFRYLMTVLLLTSPVYKPLVSEYFALLYATSTRKCKIHRIQSKYFMMQYDSNIPHNNNCGSTLPSFHNLMSAGLTHYYNF